MGQKKHVGGFVFVFLFLGVQAKVQMQTLFCGGATFFFIKKTNQRHCKTGRGGGICKLGESLVQMIFSRYFCCLRLLPSAIGMISSREKRG